MFKKLLLSFFVAVPVIAQAEWVEIDKDDEYAYFIDPTRSRVTNSSLQYAETWIKQVIHTDLSKDGLSVGDHRLVKYEFRCRTREYTNPAVYSYKKSSVVDSYTPSYTTFKSVIPDSRGEFFLDQVCNGL